MKINLTTPSDHLDNLIGQYVLNKTQFDSLKKVVDGENGEIKRIMQELDITERQVGDHIVKRVVQTKESMNMEQLLALVKKSGLSVQTKTKIIKTQEYVDMDALEDAIYNNQISPEVLLDMDTCREIKNVVTLRVSTVKRPKEDIN